LVSGLILPPKIPYSLVGYITGTGEETELWVNGTFERGSLRTVVWNVS